VGQRGYLHVKVWNTCIFLEIGALAGLLEKYGFSFQPFLFIFYLFFITIPLACKRGVWEVGIWELYIKLGGFLQGDGFMDTR